MNILIFGGDGFIGTNIVNRLVQDENTNVSVYARNTFQKNENCKYYTGDLYLEENLEYILNDIDVIIYLITSITPASSMANKLLGYQKDIPMLIKVLDAALEKKIKRVVFISSGGTIYGENKIANSEDMKENPVSHYAILKLASEKILLMYNQLYGMENIILRVSNPYGGNFHNKEVGIINVFLNKILNNEELIIFGDGNIVRDFVNVSYVVDAVYKSLTFSIPDKCIPVFNIGSGKGISLNELLYIIKSIIRKKISIRYIEGRNFDVKNNVLCIEKAKHIMKYTPPVDSEADIKEFIELYLKKFGK